MTKISGCVVLMAIFAIGAGSPAHAILVVGYTSSNPAANATLPADATATGVTGINLSRGPGLVQASGPRFRSDGFASGTSSSAAATAGDYLEWGFTSTTAYDLTGLDIRYGRNGAGPRQIDLQLNVNDSGFTSFFTDSAVSTSGATHLNIALTSFTNVTKAVFRLIGFDANSSGSRTLRIGNSSLIEGSRGIVVNGVVAVPEPSAFLFGGLVCGVLGVNYARKRKVSEAKPQQ